MTNRSDLMRAIRDVSDAGGRPLAEAVAALDAFDRRTADLASRERETDLGARIAAQRLAPFAAHERHTAATDWLAAYDVPSTDYRTAMIAEASTWYRALPREVRADREELSAQADGRARALASVYGPQMSAARSEFIQTVGYLHAQAASGLPQIDQLIDPNNQPSATPYPTQVFPTFGADQDPFNQNVEGFNHDSQVSSQQAPLIQQVTQQDQGGSGFGAGPERPDAHTTTMDTADSYAEVPLGPPGQIPAAPAATGQGASAPNPVAGVPQDAGADRRQVAAAVIDGYSLPDPFGYRWAMQADVMHPFHERCGSGHWPEEGCYDRAHAASVAVGYLMDIDAARRQAQCEAVGVREGLRAVSASHSAAELGAAHNRFTAAWGQTDRTDEDSAVLHGFMAVVRPVLAEMHCTACKGGDCSDCTSPDCACAKHPKGTGSRMGAAGGVSEPRGKVARYVGEMAKQYGASPVGE